MKGKHSMKRITFLLLCCFIACFVTACGGGEQEETSVQETMTIAAMPSIDKVPIIVGMEQGYFEDHGLTVTLENFQSPTDRNAALQAGEVDGVMSDMVADVLYLAAGMDMKMTSLIQTDFAIIASTNSGITSLDDITGNHTNGIALNCLMEYIADEAGEAQKVMVPDVMTRIEQVLSGDLDLAVVPEPYGAMAEARGAVRIGSSNDLGIYAAVMLFPEEYIENHGEAVSAFYRGYADAVEYLQNNGIDDVLDAVIKVGEFSEDAANALKATEFVPLEVPEESQFTDIIAWMDQHPEFDGPYDYLQFEDITDVSVLEEIS